MRSHCASILMAGILGGLACAAISPSAAWAEKNPLYQADNKESSNPLYTGIIASSSDPSQNQGVGVGLFFDTPVHITALGAYVGTVTTPGSVDLALFAASDHLPNPTTGAKPLLFSAVNIASTGLIETDELSLDLPAGEYFLAALPSALRTGSGDVNLVLDEGIGASAAPGLYAPAGDSWTLHPDNPYPAFRIEGNVVPEPASLALLMGAAGGLLLKRRNR